MDRQRFSMPTMHSRTCHSCTIHRLHFAIDIEPLLYDKAGHIHRFNKMVRLSAASFLPNINISQCGSYGLAGAYASFVTALRPRLSGISVATSTLRARKCLCTPASTRCTEYFFACDRHPLVCVGGVFPLTCMLLACVATKRRFNRRCNCTFRR